MKCDNRNKRLNLLVYEIDICLQSLFASLNTQVSWEVAYYKYSFKMLNG